MDQDDYYDLEAELDGAISEVERLTEELNDAYAVIKTLQDKLDAIEELL